MLITLGGTPEMTRNDNPGIGNLIINLSRKMDQMQREIIYLRQEVKTLNYMVRELSSGSRSSADTDIPEYESED